MSVPSFEDIARIGGAAATAIGGFFTVKAWQKLGGQKAQEQMNALYDRISAGYQERIVQLEASNSELRQQNAKLRRRVTNLEKAVAKLASERTIEELESLDEVDV